MAHNSYGLAPLLTHRKTIFIKKSSDVVEEFPALTATIYPGMAVIVGVDNGEPVFKLPGAAAPKGPVIVATEREMFGQNISKPYGTGDPVNGWIPGAGDVVYFRTALTTLAIGSPVAVQASGMVDAAGANPAVGVTISNPETVSYDVNGVPTNFTFVPVLIA